MVRRFSVFCAALALAAAGCSSSGSAPNTPLPLRHVADIPLPGRTTRFDYADVDPGRHLLVVAHLGDSEVIAVSLDQRRVAWTAPKIDSVHGVRIDADHGRVFVTATGTNEVVALDEATGRELDRARTGSFPDGVAVDQSRGLVLVSNKDSGNVSVLRADSLEPVNTIDAGGDTGNTQVDSAGGRAFVANGKDNQLLTIDTTHLAVTGRDELPGCKGAHGVALDPKTPRAYVACEDNATLVVEDLTTHKESAHLEVGSNPDVLAIDPDSRRLYVAAESGTVTVVALDPEPTVVGRAKLADNAHTVGVDPTLHVIAFALTDVGGHPVLRLESPD